MHMFGWQEGPALDEKYKYISPSWDNSDRSLTKESMNITAVSTNVWAV